MQQGSWNRSKARNATNILEDKGVLLKEVNDVRDCKIINRNYWHRIHSNTDAM